MSEKVDVEAQRALLVQVGYCGDCDGLHLVLYDNNREPFADAVIDQETAKAIAAEMQAYVREGSSARFASRMKDAGLYKQ